ncbi:Uncharacterised protein [Bordetella pertussis]|nr:Uncharacterised protein [Bordetella pertussis]
MSRACSPATCLRQRSMSARSATRKRSPSGKALNRLNRRVPCAPSPCMPAPTCASPPSMARRRLPSACS